ncbi:MAG TPA: hypothetical protein VD862_00220 [Candidatus Paceibacterota bacterium]|nr:hypothetical protein [Candidatus Paceibacterota bacterium]
MMNELDRKVRKAVLSVKRRRITERIGKLLRHFKAVQFKQHSAHTEHKGSLTVSIAGAPAVFHEESFGPYDANTLYRVKYGDRLMLEVVVGLDNLAEGVDPRLVYEDKAGHTVVVKTFKTGVWMKGLDLNWHLRQEERRKKEAAKFREREKALRARPKPVREDDYSISQRFGLDVPKKNRAPKSPSATQSWGLVDDPPLTGMGLE